LEDIILKKKDVLSGPGKSLGAPSQIFFQMLYFILPVSVPVGQLEVAIDQINGEGEVGCEKKKGPEQETAREPE
jgi:hypothetical protein